MAARLTEKTKQNMISFLNDGDSLACIDLHLDNAAFSCSLIDQSHSHSVKQNFKSNNQVKEFSHSLDHAQYHNASSLNSSQSEADY